MTENIDVENPDNFIIEVTESGSHALGVSGVSVKLVANGDGSFGKLWMGRDSEVILAAQEGHNNGSIASCCGGLIKFTDIQMQSLIELCKVINNEFKKQNLKISFHGHCEVNNHKTCPNFDYKKLIKLDKSGFIQE